MVVLQKRHRQTLTTSKNNSQHGKRKLSMTTVITAGMIVLFIVLFGLTLSLGYSAITTTTTSSSSSSSSTTTEGYQLRRDRVNRSNRPNTIQFVPSNDQHDFQQQQPQHPQQQVAPIQQGVLACGYKSLNDLTESEIQPMAGDGNRHMKTPPIGGKVSLVCCDTTVGPLSIVAHSAWAPRGAQRFLDMVESNYFNDGVPLFRCMKGFLCQFGLSSNATKHSKEFSDTILDDPNWLPEGKDHRQNAVSGIERFSKGYLAYAGAGPNSRNKQFILALGMNGPLGGGSPWEVPWGELVGPDSFETSSKIYTGYGDNGPKQGRLMREGVTDALREEFPKLDYITSCHLLDERVQEEPFFEPGR